MKAKIVKQASARHFDDIPYVLESDIKEIHGKSAHKKFCEALRGSTGVLVPANHKSHGLKKQQFGIYYWDYERFLNQIERGIQTYFD